MRSVLFEWNGWEDIKAFDVWLCFVHWNEMYMLHTFGCAQWMSKEYKPFSCFLDFSISPSTDGLNNKRGINFFRLLLHWQWMNSFDIRNLKHVSWPFIQRTNSISTESVSVHGELSIYEWVSFEFDGNIPQNYIIKCFPILSCRLSSDSIPYAPKCSHSYLNSYVMELRCIHILLCVIRLWHRLPTWLV